MAVLGKLLAAPLKAVGLVSTPKVAKLATPLPVATRDDAAAIIERDDELRRRRGGAADILNGVGGAEPAAAGGKVTLGS